MKKLQLIMISAAVLLVACYTHFGTSESEKYSSTIKIFRESDVVNKFFKTCYGYAVFPTIGKAGWIVGGSYGKGRVYRNGKVTGIVSIVEGSVGFQLGGKTFSEIIFFKDKRAYNEFTSGGFEFDATAQAIAITAGAEVKAGTSGSSAGASTGPRTGIQAKARYFKGMATFLHSKGGLMYEASISGQKFRFKPIIKR